LHLKSEKLATSLCFHKRNLYRYASAALSISSIPWNGPVGAVRVSVVDGEIVLNPSDDDIENSEFTLFYAGTR
jgi:polyribonucleotide nucleotidyltransferase